jgi:hypothetical protein
MSREFTLHLLQKDLQTQNERWLKLELTSPRVVSPFATHWPAKHHWLSTNTQAGFYHQWGLWSLGLNSVTVRPDDSKTLGLAPPERRGWRYSLRSFDLEFVEFWQMTDSPPTIETAAVLTHARQTDRGFAPFSPTGERTAKWTDFGRGFIQQPSAFLVKGSVTWNLTPD